MKCRQRYKTKGVVMGGMDGKSHQIGQNEKQRERNQRFVIHLKHPLLSFHGLVVCLLLSFLLLLCLVEGSHIPQSYLNNKERGGEGESGERTTNRENILLADEELQQEEEGTTIVIDLNSEERQNYENDDKQQEPSRSSSENGDKTLNINVLNPPTEKTVSKPGVNANNVPIVGADGKRYTEVLASCDSSQIQIFTQFPSPFKGRIYTYGYSDATECGLNAFSDPTENVTINLPLGQCGVQMMVDPDVDEDSSAPKRHEVTLYIQYSSFLQQAIDDKVSVSCVEITQPQEPGSSRQARKMGGGGGIGIPKDSSSIAKMGESWMEILHGKDPSPKSRKSAPVAVGQDVTLVISTKIIRGYDARIVNCSANDGSRFGSNVIDGFRSQLLLDSAGCSVDTSLVPNFRRRRLPIESRNRIITLHFATFPAFKFPERDHLHVKCQVAYCQGPCPQDPCDSGFNHFGTWREKYGRVAEALVETQEIVNSIQVFAPDLELGESDVGSGHHFERHQSQLIPLGGSATDLTYPSTRGRQLRLTDPEDGSGSKSSSASQQNRGGKGNSNGERVGTVCVSPGSVILALVILGVVLVISASATLWFALKRSESRKYRQAMKHSPSLFHQHTTGGQYHNQQPYYRFSHW